MKNAETRNICSLEPLARVLRMEPVEVIALMGELCVSEVLEVLRLRRDRRRREATEEDEGWEVAAPPPPIAIDAVEPMPWTQPIAHAPIAVAA